MFEAQAAAAIRPEDSLPIGGEVSAYNNFWIDQGARLTDDQRTSLIIDPPDGRLPALQPGVESQVLSLDEDLPGTRPVRVRAAGIGADSYEDRGLGERCLVGFNSGPPIMPAGYNQNIQIFQTAEHIAILTEMVHEVRVVPLDGREHLAADITAVGRQLARPLGGRHAGDRDDQTSATSWPATTRPSTARSAAALRSSSPSASAAWRTTRCTTSTP